MSWPWETKTSTCRNFATISSGLYRFLAIAVLLDVDTYLKSDHFVGGGSMVSRNSDDRRVIVEIRLVELRPVICAFPVVVNDVTQVIEKRRPIRRLGIYYIIRHKARYPFNVSGSIHAASIADGMKYKLAAALNALQRGRIEDRIETQSKWRQPRRRRQ